MPLKKREINPCGLDLRSRFKLPGDDDNGFKIMYRKKEPKEPGSQIQATLADLYFSLVHTFRAPARDTKVSVGIPVSGISHLTKMNCINDNLIWYRLSTSYSTKIESYFSSEDQ